MECPECHAPFSHVDYHGVSIQECPQCAGIWFEKNQLRDYISQYFIDHPDLPAAKLEYHKLIIGEENLPHGTKTCPRCHCLMTLINYGYDSNILVNKCPKCHGLWTPKSLLSQFAVYFKGNPTMNALGNDLVREEKTKETIKDLVELGDTLSHSAAASPSGPILPLGLDFRSKTFPYVTIGIILLNVGAFIYEIINWDTLDTLIHQYGFLPSAVLQNGEYYRFITSLFLHVSILHLSGNMLFFWIFSDNVEDAMGHLKYLFLYLLFGIAGSGFHILLTGDMQTVSIGASGAISGVMGAFLVLYPTAKIKTLIVINTVDIPAFIYIFAWFFFQMVYGLLLASGNLIAQIGYGAHIGGFLCGVIIAIPFRIMKRKRV